MNLLTQLQRDLRRRFRSMDFVSQRPALVGDAKEAARYAKFHQRLGPAWESLALPSIVAGANNWFVKRPGVWEFHGGFFAHERFANNTR